MVYYLKLRTKIISRFIRAFGLAPALAIGLAFAAFAALVILLYSKTDFGDWVVLIAGILFLFKAKNIKREEFLISILLKSTYLKLRLLENLLISFPFVIVLAIRLQFWMIAGFLISIILMAYIKGGIQINNVVPSPFRNYPFEFSIGFRRYFLPIIFICFLLIIAIAVGNENLGLFALMLFPFISIAYYAYPENELYVWIYDKNPKAFLINKIKIALKCSAVFISPLLILYCVFFPFKAMLALILSIIGILYVSFFVLAKYAAYPEHINLPQSLFIVSSFAFPPLMILTGPYFYRKAIHTLQSRLA